MFKRNLRPIPGHPNVLQDPALPEESQYTQSFGFEWTEIDGFIGKEVMSHGHLFGRFLLPADFFVGKTVADIGCGNGRIGRLIAPDCARYFGVDMSHAVNAFPRYIDNIENITLVRASGTDLPFEDQSVDVAVCWGVMHHMDDPDKAFSELVRIVKPGGHILIFIYPKAFDARANFNNIIREIDPQQTYRWVEATSDALDGWSEVDDFYGGMLANNMHMSTKHSREWQIFQWYDGISPRYHWSLVDMLRGKGSEGLSVVETMEGVYRISQESNNE